MELSLKAIMTRMKMKRKTRTVPHHKSGMLIVTKALDGEDMYGPSTVILLHSLLLYVFALHFHLKLTI